MKRRWGALVACAAFAMSCSEFTGPAGTRSMSMVGLVNGVNGHVVLTELGVWLIETSDGRRLDPHESLPEAFRSHGLAVRVAARALTDVGCFHMAGVIVEITAIRTR